MEILFKKGKSKDVMACKRADGSSTWMQTDRFMTIHDLAHYCVECELGMDKGFYGLVASGVDVTDFENKEKIRARNLPEESVVAELIVNLILTERSDNRVIENFNETLRASASQRGLSRLPSIEDQKLDSIRKQLDDLLNRWTFLPIDQAMVLTFPEE